MTTKDLAVMIDDLDARFTCVLANMDAVSGPGNDDQADRINGTKPGDRCCGGSRLFRY